MVDTEDGDILVLTDLVREESGISQNSQATTSSSDESTSQAGLSRIRRLSPCRPSVIDIETLEEIEDRIALGQVPPLSNTVHFRSRLSLIPEHVPSTVEECEEPSESSHALSMEENTDSPTPTRRGRLQNVFSSLLSRRKSKDVYSPTSELPPSS
ncbi:hypothetical protein TELCIR_09178 [Teladorsagia circumcincta]|uniref:Uncharacterized protein n=1 Tax=Teladorsagia circumcincta TaxID=45464 RepID=A0A2G9UHP8_TELCI|nr:hypothetical protein TELCIR_09178 [Teladorsagia circumcincta]